MSTTEILSIVKELVQNGFDIVFIKQGLKITLFLKLTNITTSPNVMGVLYNKTF